MSVSSPSWARAIASTTAPNGTSAPSPIRSACAPDRCAVRQRVARPAAVELEHRGVRPAERTLPPDPTAFGELDRALVERDRRSHIALMLADQRERERQHRNVRGLIGEQLDCLACELLGLLHLATDQGDALRREREGPHLGGGVGVADPSCRIEGKCARAREVVLLERQERQLVEPARRLGVTARDLRVDDRALERTANRGTALLANVRVKHERQQLDLEPDPLGTDEPPRMLEAAIGESRGFVGRQQPQRAGGRRERRVRAQRAVVAERRMMGDLAGALAVTIGKRRERTRDLEVKQAPARLRKLVVRGRAHEVVGEVPFDTGRAHDRAPLELVDRACEVGERHTGDGAQHVGRERRAERCSPGQDVSRRPLDQLETVDDERVE